MASFAPAFQKDNNDWLNELVHDIVDPSSVHQDRHHHQHHHSEDWDGDAADTSSHAENDEEDEIAQIKSKSSTGSLSRLGALSPWSRRSDSESRSRSRHRSRSRRTTARSPLARDDVQYFRPMPIPESSDVLCEEEGGSECLRAGSVRTFNPYVRAPNRVGSPSSHLDSEKAPSRMTDRSYMMTPPPPYPRSAFIRNLDYKPRASTFTTRTSDGKLIPRAPLSQDYYAPSRPPFGPVRTNSTLSVTSHFSGFPSHPGVRPLALKEREVLGEAAGPTDEDHQYPGPLPLTLIILGVTLAVFIVSVNRNVVATAIPNITARFHSYADIGWYGSAYLLTASAFQPMYGRVYVAFDTKWSFLVALVVFELGSLLCGISPSSDALIVGRAIQGLGSAGILTGAFVVGTHSVRIEARPVLFAGVGVLYGAGALCGPLLGGVLTDYLSWRWCFYINLPIGAVTFLTVFLFFTPQRHLAAARPPFWVRIKQLDWIGNVILLGACTMLFLALQFSETRYTWSSAPCIGLICGFGVTVMIFIAWMFYKGKDALIPVHIARQRTVAASCGAAFFIYGATLIHAYYLPIWFQAIKGDSAVHSGVNMIPYMVANAFFSLFAGIFVSKNGLFAPPAIIGCAIGAVGAGFLATLHPNTSTAKWAGYEVLVSAGLGMAIQQGFSAVQTALPLHEVPIGTAAVVASQSAGGAIFVSVGNTLLQNHLNNANNANLIPGVNIRAVIQLGATEFRKVIPPQDLPALVELYNKALQAAFIAAVPLCGCAFLCSLCMEWRSVRRKNPHIKDEVEKKIETLPEMADTATAATPEPEDRQQQQQQKKLNWKNISASLPSWRRRSAVKTSGDEHISETESVRTEREALSMVSPSPVLERAEHVYLGWNKKHSGEDYEV